MHNLRTPLIIVALALLFIGTWAVSHGDEQLGLSVFVTEQGGTGTSTSPGEGELLIGNSSGEYDLSNSPTISGDLTVGTITATSTTATSTIEQLAVNRLEVQTTSYSYIAHEAPSFVATSTTATSTFAGGLTVDTSDFVVDPDGGFVGINTASPEANLHIAGGSGTYLLLDNQATIRFKDSSGTHRNVFYVDGSNHLRINKLGSTDIRFYDSGQSTVEMVIANGGNVGIGNASPSEKLNVQGEAAAQIFTATSTTATSTFAGGLTVDSTDFVVDPDAGRVGIGTASPSEILQIVGGNILLDNSTSLKIKNAAGTVSTAINVGAGDNLVLGSTNYDDILFNVGSVSSAVVIKETTGNVGIGTTTPQSLLHVARSFSNTPLAGTVFTVEGASGDTFLSILGDDSNDSGVIFGTESNNVSGGIFYNASSAEEMQFRTGGNTNAMTIDSSQNVGIGSTTPGQKLSVAGDVLGNEFIGSYFTATSTTATSTFAGGLAIETSGFVYDYSTNNVGIGTTPRLYKLDINSGATSPFRWVSSNATFVGADHGITYTTTETNSASQLKIIDQDNSATRAILELQGNAGAIEAMYVSSSGLTGIGTSSPDYPLDVDGDFRVGEAGSTNALFVDATNQRLGVATAVPGVTLHVTGEARVTNELYMGSSASEADPDYTWFDDQDTGFFKPTANTLGFTVGASEAIRIDSSGNVGIGVTAPIGRLNVNGGGILLGNGTTRNELYISQRVDRNNTDNSSSTVWYKFATLPITGSGNGPILKIAFTGGKYNNSEKSVFDMVVSTRDAFSADITNASVDSITEAGVVIYQEADTSYSLYIKLTGNEWSAGQLVVTDGSWSAGATFIDIIDGSPSDTSTPSGSLVFDSTDATYFTGLTFVPSTNMIGIGTVSPDSLLHISGTTAVFTIADTDATDTHEQTHFQNDAGNFRLGTSNSTGSFLSNDYLIERGSSGATQHAWRINNSEVMRIDSSGNVGIGTTTPWRTHSVTGTVAIDGLTTAVGTPSAICLQTGGEVQVNTGTATCTVSSERFKNDITDYTGGLKTILQLRPATFEYKTVAGVEEIGLIAEEVEKIDKRLVTYDNEDKVRSLKFSGFIGVIVDALQDIIKLLEKIYAQVLENKKDIQEIKDRLDEEPQLGGITLESLLQ